MSAPRFTIITATYNRANFLRAAIASVQAQGRSDVEHLIIDGASTDGTRELLAEFPHLRVISEPDRGIYDAFNKGLALAQGEIVHFLNSDDLLVPGALLAIDQAMADESIDLASGGVEFFAQSADGAEQMLRRETAPERLEFSLHQVLSGLPAINARFFRRRVAASLGPFDLRYRIAADREWLVRLALRQPRGVVVPSVVYRYLSHGGSLTIHESERNMELIRTEHLTLAETHLAQPALHPADRSELIGLHRRESAALAVDCAAAGHWRAAAAAAQRGCGVSPLWPFAGAKRLAGWLLGRSSRYNLAPPESGRK